MPLRVLKESGTAALPSLSETAALFRHIGNCAKHRAASTKQLDFAKLFGSGSGHGLLFRLIGNGVEAVRRTQDSLALQGCPDARTARKEGTSVV